MTDRDSKGTVSWQEKKREYEERMARAKGKERDALKSCRICGIDSGVRACQGCGTVAYCSTDCQRIDWRDRGHRKACKKIQNERAEEAARASAPNPPPSPPKQVFYGPAPRSHADEVRARIAAEHEAARLRREANPEPELLEARFGSRCPICLEEWDVNAEWVLRCCCCRKVCLSCEGKIGTDACPLCRVPLAKNDAENLARLRRHVENEVPEAIVRLALAYRDGDINLDIVKSEKKSAKLMKRAVQLGSVVAMEALGTSYYNGIGVKQDTKKAMRLIRIAADKGHVPSMHNLGIGLCKEGKMEEGFSFMKRSAELGYIESWDKLAYLYAAGLGVEVDVEEAKRWYERAAEKGHAASIAALEKLRSHL